RQGPDGGDREGPAAARRHVRRPGGAGDDPRRVRVAPRQGAGRAAAEESQAPADDAVTRAVATMAGSSHHKETNMLKRLGLLALGLTVLGLAGHTASGADDKKKEDKKVDPLVFELRTYHANPGKMTALHARFRVHTNKMFEKHGMTI